MPPTRAVWFSKNEQKIYEELVERGLTLKAFPRYCKDAFYNQVVRDRMIKRGKNGTKNL